MHNFWGYYRFVGRGFCGLFIVDDYGNCKPINPENINQFTGYILGEWF